MGRLVEALNDKPVEARGSALLSLEAVHDKASPDATLLAMNAKFDDVRRWALVRLFQRKLLDDQRVQAAVRRNQRTSSPAILRYNGSS